jgi:putative flippase GtrA
MRGLISKSWAWSHTHEGRKLIRYTAVSGISTMVSFLTLFIVFGVLKLWSQVPSTIFANLVASVPSYYLNRSWAWGKSGRSHLTREIIPFWTMGALGIIVSIFGAQLARHVSIKYNLPHWEQTLLVLAANIVSFGIFWVLKLLLFNKLFHFELEEFDEHLTEEEQAAITKGA